MVQVLGQVYAVLSDTEQRAVYDEQGLVDEDSDILRQDRCWEDYWRLLFPKVPQHGCQKDGPSSKCKWFCCFHPQITLQDILDFEKTYKGSEEEKRDVIQLYLQHKGDMDAITASVLCSNQEDEPRICSIIQAAIDDGAVKAFAAFTRESEKKKKARRRKVSTLLAVKLGKLIFVRFD